MLLSRTTTTTTTPPMKPDADLTKPKRGGHIPAIGGAQGAGGDVQGDVLPPRREARSPRGVSRDSGVAGDFQEPSVYVYIAGPYTGVHHDWRSYFEIDRNINRALEAAAALAQAGIGFFCPHAHSAHFEVIRPEVKAPYWYALDIHFMRSCDALLLLVNWQHSKGSLEEKRLMEKWGRPVFESVDSVIAWAKGEGVQESSK